MRQGRPFGEAVPVRCPQNVYISGRPDHLIPIPATSLHSTGPPAEGTQLTVGEALSLQPLVGVVPDSQNRRIETSTSYRRCYIETALVASYPGLEGLLPRY